MRYVSLLIFGVKTCTNEIPVGYNLFWIIWVLLVIGKLILSVDKDTYEELGLQGHPSLYSGKKPMRYSKYPSFIDNIHTFLVLKYFYEDFEGGGHPRWDLETGIQLSSVWKNNLATCTRKGDCPDPLIEYPSQDFFTENYWNSWRCGIFLEVQLYVSIWGMWVLGIELNRSQY